MPHCLTQLDYGVGTLLNACSLSEAQWWLVCQFISSSVRLSVARERVVGWYHTGPKLHRNDIAIQELVSRYCTNPVLVIVDPKPKDFGLPTDAYYAVEEVHDVSGRGTLVGGDCAV